MSLRLTEEEYAQLMARRHTDEIAGAMARRGKGNAPRGESVAHLRGSDLPGVAVENTPHVEVHDEIDAWKMPEEAGKRPKYGNRRVEIDGIKFDSQHEANVYQELMLRVKAGELRCVIRQVAFDLPGGIRYIADFVTIRPDMSIEGVYDAKSVITRKNRVYINKRKQMLACWGIEIREV